MNKSELIEITAKEADISKAAAEKALSAAMGAIVKAVSKGDTVTLVGFGSFKSSKRAARVGRNPQTGKELKIAATTVPRFTAGATFKAAVAGKKAAKKKVSRRFCTFRIQARHVRACLFLPAHKPNPRHAAATPTCESYLLSAIPAQSALAARLEQAYRRGCRDIQRLGSVGKRNRGAQDAAAASELRRQPAPSLPTSQTVGPPSSSS
jgi:DNA-binding protein HU-beta